MAQGDFFQLLGIGPAFDLDVSAVEAAYFQQQRLHHPDRFAGKKPRERQAALQRSGDINNAYQTLKNPLSRAQYLLQLQGIAVGTEADTVKPLPALLMETMEWRETIAEAQSAHAAVALGNELDGLIAQSVQMLSAQFAGQQWDKMAQETLRLGYLQKAKEAVMLQKKRWDKHAV